MTKKGEGRQVDLEELIGKAIREHPKGKQLDGKGREVVSPVPIAPPIGYKADLPLHEKIRNMVRSEQLRLEAERAGMETFAESDDFDIGDDYDPRSPYELEFEPPEPLAPGLATPPPLAAGAGSPPEGGPGDKPPVAAGEGSRSKVKKKRFVEVEDDE